MKSENEKDDVLICRCEEITYGEIVKAIEDGFETIEDIKRTTRAGMGLCQGRSCSKTIARIISEKTGKSLEEILQTKYRFPVRPEKIGIFHDEKASNE